MEAVARKRQWKPVASLFQRVRAGYGVGRQKKLTNNSGRSKRTVGLQPSYGHTFVTVHHYRHLSQLIARLDLLQ